VSGGFGKDMQKSLIRVAIGYSENLWHEKFADALKTRIEQGYPFDFDVVHLDHHDWLDVIQPYDVVLWKPTYMGPRSVSYFKEKIYFLEKYLHKLVLPNFATIWTFESKIAQSYLFHAKQVPIPETFVSFRLGDSLSGLQNARYPLVFKKSFGAASKNVRIMRNRSEAEKIVRMAFNREVWDSLLEHHSSKLVRVMRNIGKPWFWARLRDKILNEEIYGQAYWQEFIPGNEADLRITVVGNCYAYGFWRLNRPNDFRASGSGRLDFQREIPVDLLRYCMNLSGELDFDSMAYDIIFKGGQFVVTEISYGYLDTAPNRSRGYYELDADDITLHEGHFWPEELWVKWLLKRAGLELLGQKSLGK
jgi:glutathione synthase/RimK-type ligase-like ATP-grasp enzyme